MKLTLRRQLNEADAPVQQNNQAAALGARKRQIQKQELLKIVGNMSSFKADGVYALQFSGDKEVQLWWKNPKKPALMLEFDCNELKCKITSFMLEKDNIKDNISFNIDATNKFDANTINNLKNNISTALVNIPDASNVLKNLQESYLTEADPAATIIAQQWGNSDRQTNRDIGSNNKQLSKNNSAELNMVKQAVQKLSEDITILGTFKTLSKESNGILSFQYFFDPNWRIITKLNLQIINNILAISSITNYKASNPISLAKPKELVKGGAVFFKNLVKSDINIAGDVKDAQNQINGQTQQAQSQANQNDLIKQRIAKFKTDYSNVPLNGVFTEGLREDDELINGVADIGKFNQAYLAASNGAAKSELIRILLAKNNPALAQKAFNLTDDTITLIKNEILDGSNYYGESKGITCTKFKLLLKTYNQVKGDLNAFIIDTIGKIQEQTAKAELGSTTPISWAELNTQSQGSSDTAAKMLNQKNNVTELYYSGPKCNRNNAALAKNEEGIRKELNKFDFSSIQSYFDERYNQLKAKNINADQLNNKWVENLVGAMKEIEEKLKEKNKAQTNNNAQAANIPGNNVQN